MKQEGNFPVTVHPFIYVIDRILRTSASRLRIAIHMTSIPFIMREAILDFRMSENELLLNYELQTEKCSWSIFDNGGVEITNGRLLGNGPHRIPLGRLSPDVYQLCIIDGDRLLNTRFRIS